MSRGSAGFSCLPENGAPIFKRTKPGDHKDRPYESFGDGGFRFNALIDKREILFYDILWRMGSGSKVDRMDSKSI